MGFIALQYTPSNNLVSERVEHHNLQASFSVASDYETLTYVKSDPVKGEIFNLTKKGYGETYQFAFDIRYYNSWQADGQTSGDYIFRPEANQYDSYKYTTLKKVYHTQSDNVAEIYLTYYNETSENSVDVIVRLEKDKPYMQWDVKIGSVKTSLQGVEITANFWALDFDNENTFYTDSNGLEMQERILNFRSSYTFVSPINNNVTSNYYPIQTAIAARDTKKKLQLTVMNSRSQGGSVIIPGRIELM